MRANFKKLLEEADNHASEIVKVSYPSDVDFFMPLKRYLDDDKDGNTDRVKPKLVWYDKEARKEEGIEVSDALGFVKKRPSDYAKKVMKYAYPRKTKLGVRSEGARRYRPIEECRVYVKKFLEPTDYKAFNNAYRFFEVRHTKFVSSLTDQAKVIYKNMREDPALNLMYKSRWGFQRTNFVIAFLAKTLLQNAEEMIDEAQHLFNTMQQMEGQSGMSHVDALQKKRTELQNLGVRITDQQMKSRIYTSLNPTFKKHFQHYRYSQVTLQEFQDAIRDADASDKRNLQVQRRHQEDVWNLTKAETISHDLRESLQNGDQEDLPEFQPRAAESFRENDVKDEFSQQQRNTFLKTPREFSEANEVTLPEYPSSQPPYKKLKAVGAIPRTHQRWNKWVNPNRRRWK